MADQHEITTERLLLKSVTPAFINELFRSEPKEAIMRYFGYDEAGYNSLQTMREQGMETHRLSLFYFLLVEKQSGRPVGECGFHTWNRAHQRAELFYSLRNDADKRKGLMTEALPAVLAYGFAHLNLHRIEALTASWNTPSLRLLSRFGFTKEGTMRQDYVVAGKHEDSECFSLLKWEWERSKPGNSLANRF